MSSVQQESLGTIEIFVTLNGAEHKFIGSEGQRLVEVMDAAEFVSPTSCRQGDCATCMCQLEEGSVEMLQNQTLDRHDIERGWILACQAVPTSKRIRVVYPT